MKTDSVEPHFDDFVYVFAIFLEKHVHVQVNSFKFVILICALQETYIRRMATCLAAGSFFTVISLYLYVSGIIQK